MIDEKKLIEDLIEASTMKRQDNMPSDYFKLSELEFLISRQPQVNKWIPCSERLPTEDEYLDEFGNAKELLITTKEKEICFTHIESEVISAYFSGKNFYTTAKNSGFETIYHEVLAWQPLSEKYKGE